MGIQRRNSNETNTTLRGRATGAVDERDIWLTHVTTTGIAREILVSKQFEPRKCKVMRSDLVYFFALRPAYGKKHDTEKSEQIGRFPAIFIVDPTGLDAPHHVYPFDTGGAVNGVFGDAPAPYVYLEDYELDPSLGASPVTSPGLLAAGAPILTVSSARICRESWQCLMKWDAATSPSRV